MKVIINWRANLKKFCECLVPTDINNTVHNNVSTFIYIKTFRAAKLLLVRMNFYISLQHKAPYNKQLLDTELQGIKILLDVTVICHLILI